jgi:hypothetical protein
MNKCLTCLLLLLSLYALPLYATGPSTLKAFLKPVSVNAKGFILCKTILEVNSTGARMIMPVKLGWAVVSQSGKIEEFPWFEFLPENYTNHDLILNHYEYLTKIYNQTLDWKNPPLSLLHIIEKYGFKENNVKKYTRAQKLKRAVFLKTYALNEQTQVQTTLGKHRSTAYGEHVLVSFAFKNIIFLNNTLDSANSDIPLLGAKFDFTYQQDKDSFDYEVFEITGIIPLKK